METQDIKKEEIVENKDNSAVELKTETRFDHVKATLELLYTLFPLVFIKEGEAKPLKIGIFEDLKEKIKDNENLSISKVRAALRLYTSRLKYLYSVKENAARIDIDGNATEDKVTAEHEAYAKEKIAEINAKRKPLKPKKTFDKKNSFKKNGKRPFAKKPYKVEGIEANAENLKVGTDVLVLSSTNHSVRGVVAEPAQRDTVLVTLNSGLTVSLPLSRVLLPKK